MKTRLVLLVLVLGTFLPVLRGQGACGWSSWNATNGAVEAMEVWDDGTGPALYVGGGFQLAGGVPANNIARWDGVTWSPLGLGTVGGINAMAVFDDGTGEALYVAGPNQIVTSSGTPVGIGGGLARWDGTSWSAVPPPSWAGMVPNPIWALDVYDDGTGPGLYFAGSFGHGSFPSVHNIGRWDGSSYSWLNGGFVGSWVNTLCVFDDGTGPALYVGGSPNGFSLFGALAKWNGSAWSAVGGGVAGPGPASGSANVGGLMAYDGGAGSALVATGNFSSAGGAPANSIARWDGATWSALGAGFSGAVPGAPTVFDEGGGPALFVRDYSLGYISKWDGLSWSALPAGPIGGPPRLQVFDDGSGPALFAHGGSGAGVGMAGKWSCGSTISLSSSQLGGPGQPVFISNTNLNVGAEYFNIFSVETCTGGLGAGPWLGLCASPGPNLQFLILQATLPLGAPPFHFTAYASHVNWGPFALPAATLEAVCFELTGGTIGPVSPVTSIVVQ